MFSSTELGPNAPMTAVFLYVSKEKAINELSTTNIEPLWLFVFKEVDCFRETDNGWNKRQNLVLNHVIFNML